MRQGGGVPTGKWQGSAAGGVTAPDAIIPPDLSRRFAATAARLEARAIGHPMADWLRFMADLSWAQHEAVEILRTTRGRLPAEIDRAVRAQLPPLATDSLQRDAIWRSVLVEILSVIDRTFLPQEASISVNRLRLEPGQAIEQLADQFLAGSLPIEEAGSSVFIAAALQVYFTVLAAQIPRESLRLLSRRGLCPCCGSTPSIGVVKATGKAVGTRYLYCSLCSTAWNHVRAICVTCGDSRTVTLREIENGDGLVKAETCNACHTYAKIIYEKQDPLADPYADDLSSLGLDIVVSQADWSRHAPNPLLLMG